ncbi:AFG2-interacting ribosome maturation factor [Cololabis saira]|uniref:AFG2-interacting ribosome maturation factor n=1 Tax=Cololabis saira TaxID=129043 RepID=UPI002AD352C7|nr:AFG2-interacting ribosome maturation factor [Cololabis saira]
MCSLQPALRRSFQTLDSSRRVWAEVLAECWPLLEALGNLAEQMAALARVNISETPLRKFPDLQERLQFKLLQGTDTVLGRLSEHMCRLQSARDAISNQLSAVLQLYEQSADVLDLPAVTERSATSPSVADMLEWLQDAERHYRQQLLRRKTLLLSLRPDDLAQLESAPRRWKSLESPDAEQRISDTLCKVSSFMESQ